MYLGVSLYRYLYLDLDLEVIDASIDHAKGVLISRGAHDTYSTLGPQVTICICI